jgi:peptide/nickel transport system substrate-binding protein
MKKMYRGGLSALLCLVVLFAGCVGQSKPQAKQPIVIINATIGEPESVDPAFDYETGGYEIMQNCYETLYFYDSPSVEKLVPLLAESYNVSEDGLTFTFLLRKGIKFHDGTDFNADAVVYSLNRAMKMGLDPSWMLVDYVEPDGVKKVDDYTVTIKLKFPYAAFLTIMANPISAIVSPTAVEAHGGVTEGQQNEWMDRNCVGTGPFKLESWEPKQQLIMVRNENYWGGPLGQGLAKPDKVIIRIMEDENTRILAIRAGEVDFIDLSPDRLAAVVGEPGIAFDKIGPSSSVSYLSMNRRLEYFNDINVRAAMAHAMDYDTLLTQILKGWGVRAQGPIPRNWFGHDDNLYFYDYNMDKAKEFMAKSKYPKGFKVDLAYNAGNNTRKQYALHMKDQLAPLGIEVTVYEYDFPTYLKKQRAGELNIISAGWVMDYADPDDFVQPFLHSRGAISTRVAYNDPNMDALVEAAQREMNPEKRKALYFEIQKKCMDDYTYIWMFNAINFQVRRANVTGVFYNDAFGGLFYYQITKTPSQ